MSQNRTGPSGPPNGWGSRKPTKQEILKPAEMLGLGFILAIFVGLVALVTTREPILALISAGLAFIVSLVVMAMFTLSFKQGDDERHDLIQQDDEAQKRRDQRGDSPH